MFFFIDGWKVGSGDFCLRLKIGVVECFLLILEMMFRLFKPPGFTSTQNFPACNLFSLKFFARGVFDPRSVSCILSLSGRLLPEGTLSHSLAPSL